MRIDQSLSFNMKAMDTSAAQNSSVQRAQAAADTAKAGSPDDARLKQACNDFESILVTQMFTKMRTSGPKADLFGSSDKEEMFQTMLDEERAKELCKNDFLKVGQAMFAQLTHGKSAQVPAEPVDKPIGKESD